MTDTPQAHPVTVPIRMEVIPLPGNSSPLMSFCGDGMKLLEELAGHEDFYCACLEASVAGVYLKYPKYPPRAL